MKKIISYCSCFIKDENGSTALEYALICALIFIVIVGSVTAVGNNTHVMYTHIDTAITK